ncbi:MAG: FG-GAP-like repeat-containing protein [Bifidobacteriaceae bacterium]|nr:FG-GAP-like repeat-containing protein [Bifidobacteriaceae bacterium]
MNTMPHSPLKRRFLAATGVVATAVMGLALAWVAPAGAVEAGQTAWGRQTDRQGSVSQDSTGQDQVSQDQVSQDQVGQDSATQTSRTAEATAEALAQAVSQALRQSDASGQADPAATDKAKAKALKEQDSGADRFDPLAVAPPNAPAIAEPLAGETSALKVASTRQTALVLTDPAGPVQVMVTARLVAEPFSVAGLTWDGTQAPGRVLLRAYQDGQWTEWFDLESEDGPALDSAEGQRSSGASGPAVVAGSAGIQIQVFSVPGGSLPEGLEPAIVPLRTVEPAATASATQPEPSAETTTPSSQPGGAGNGWTASSGLNQNTLSLAAPAIQPRSSWGAKAADYSGNTPAGSPIIAPRLNGAIIHHQAGSNNYTEEQVPGIIRSIQSWHMDANHWDDIGYNFLVDKYGGLWEGRQGGITSNVVGAHATDFNTGSTGVCFLGDMDAAEPSQEALDQAGKLVAWRLSLAGLTDLHGKTTYPKDPKQALKPVVAGHRDVNATACPGKYLYAKLDQIRHQSLPQPLPKAQTVASPDLDGNGWGDIVVVDEAGSLFIYPMTSANTLGPARLVGNGWSGFVVLAPGDWDGDGRADLMGQSPDGKLYLYRGTAAGFGTKVEVGHGWGGLTIRPSGDLDGDGWADILAIDNQTHDLLLYRGDGHGGWITGRGQRVGNGWAGYDLHAAGRVNADKLADIFSVDQAGRLFTYLSKPGGGFQTKVRSGNGWAGFTLFAGADMTGDKLADLVGLDRASGQLYLYRGLGNSAFATKTVLSQAW